MADRAYYEHLRESAPPAPSRDSDDIGPDPTELSLCRMLQQKYGQNIRWDVDRGAFRVWDGQCWPIDAKGQVEVWAKEIARSLSSTNAFPGSSEMEITSAIKRSESARGIAGILRLLQSEPGIPIVSCELDKDPMLLNCANGTLDCRTGRLSSFNRSDLITSRCNVVFDESAEAPRWIAHLNRIMAGDDELIAYLQRIFGVCLSGDISVQEFWIFHGVGANGKSVTVEAVQSILGPYAGIAPDSLLIARRNSEHPCELADLHGKRLIVASETEDGGKLRLQLVKKLTGDSRIKARFMRQDFFEFQRTHKTILVTNHKPRVPESTEAAWRRIRLIPFNVVISECERDDKLREKLLDELPGILAWMVRGCLEWQRTGMRPPAKVLTATSDYRNDCDTFADFLAERCIIGDFASVTRAELWSDYTAWAASSGDENTLDRAALFERTRQLPGVAEGKTKGVRRFEGVGLCASTYIGGAGE